jgi:hypothetical protein
MDFAARGKRVVDFRNLENEKMRKSKTKNGFEIEKAEKQKK